MAATTMSMWLDAVDEPACAPVVQAEAATFLASVGVTVPGALSGVAWADLEAEQGFPA